MSEKTLSSKDNESNDDGKIISYILWREFIDEIGLIMEKLTHVVKRTYGTQDPQELIWKMFWKWWISRAYSLKNLNCMKEKKVRNIEKYKKYLPTDDHYFQNFYDDVTMPFLPIHTYFDQVGEEINEA